MQEKPTMLTYVEQTPEKLVENARNSKELTGKLCDYFLEHNFKNIWIIACGSSSNASYCAAPFMRKYLGINVEVKTPGNFLYSDYRPSDDCLCFVISQSGCSTNSLEALDFLKKINKPRVGLTGNLNSDLPSHCDIAIDYGVGEEVVSYVTKGVATLAEFLMLFALEASLKQNRIDEKEYNKLIEEFVECANVHKEVQKKTYAFYKEHIKDLQSISKAYFMGFDQAEGIAKEGALKFGEAIKIPAFAFEAEEFNHGPNLQLTPNYTTFFVDDLNWGSERLLALYKAASKVTDHAFIITNKDLDDPHALTIESKLPEEKLLSPLYMLPFFQIISYKSATDLNRWPEHPLMKEFKKQAPSKTETISKIMQN